MPSGMRQPFPWESCGPTRTTHDLTDRPPSTSPDMAAAEALAGRLVPAADDGKTRRGAEGAAAWMVREYQRAGVDQTPDQIRNRVNQARRRSAAKAR